MVVHFIDPKLYSSAQARIESIEWPLNFMDGQQSGEEREEHG